MTIVLASAQEGPWAVAIDASNVYWTDFFSGTVTAVPIGGGAPTALASGQINPCSITVDATNVYWAAADGVYKAPLSVGAAVRLATGSASSIAVDGTNVYWTDNGVSSGIGSVNYVPIAGGSVTALATAQSAPLAIALDSTTVYWVSYGAGTISSVLKSGGSTTVLVTGQHDPTALVVHSGVMYWTTYMGGTVMKANVNGSSPAQLASGQAGAGTIATDGTNLFWATVSTNPGGSVAPDYVPMLMTLALPSGTPTLVIDSPATGLVVDSTNIYWTDTEAGTVSQVAK